MFQAYFYHLCWLLACCCCFFCLHFSQHIFFQLLLDLRGKTKEEKKTNGKHFHYKQTNRNIFTKGNIMNFFSVFSSVFFLFVFVVCSSFSHHHFRTCPYICICMYILYSQLCSILYSNEIQTGLKQT